MKIIKNGSSIIVVTDDGNILHKDNCTNGLFEEIKQAESTSKLLYLMVDGYKEVIDKKIEVDNYLTKINNSNILVYKNNSVYWKGVSELSMPKTLVESVLEAESNDDKDALEAYRNFWVLLSLNPDSKCRENLYWFLDKWGMKISKSGLFIAYRNVDIYKENTESLFTQELCDFTINSYNKVRNLKKSTSLYWICNYDTSNTPYLVYAGSDEFIEAVSEEVPMLNLKSTYNELKAVDFKIRNLGNNTIYTDHHSHTFRIKIGEAVTMPRNQVDSNQNVTCSSGLHVASAGWLEANYFGDQGIVVLVNPKDVCAVPPQDSYGKMRVCKYLPIALVDFNTEGHVIEYNVEDGFESKWVTEILYDGEFSTEDKAAYTVEIPDVPELNRTIVDNNLLAIARTYMK